MSKSASALLVLIFTAVLAPAPAQTPKEEETPSKSGVPVPAGAVGIVDGELLTLGAFLDLLHERFIAHPAGVAALEDLIQRRVIEVNMERRGIEIGEAELAKHYAELDRQYREATDGKMTIARAIVEEGVTEAEFMRRLRLQLALQKMAEQDFKRSELTAADQKQWIKSKTLDAEIEQDPAKLPAGSIARVYGTHVTKEDFAKTVVKALPKRDIVDHARTSLEAVLAKKLAREAGVEITDADRDAQFQLFKEAFESNPKYEGIGFEDLLRQQSGLSVEAYKRSAGFVRELCLAKLGRIWMKDEDAARIYEEKKGIFGPKMDVRHIFLRAEEDPAPDDLTRTFEEAERQAEAILDRIRKGDSFDELVKVLSEDAASKFKGGRLDVFTPDSLKRFAALEVALKDMKAGEVAGPVRSSRGLHIIKLEQVEPAPPLSPEIVQDLRKSVAFESFRTAWRDAARGIDLTALYGDA